MTSSLTMTAAQIAQLNKDTKDGTANFVVGYNDINSFITADTTATSYLDSGTKYWYSQAPLINDATKASVSKYFIRDVTEYGERLSGMKTGNTQTISNTIAQNVILQAINTGRITTLDNLLGQDITAATGTYGLTIGGWGGSFYYWNEKPITPAGITEASVGAQIEVALPSGANYDFGGQFDVFLAVNGAAVADQSRSFLGVAATTWNAAKALVGAGAELPTALGYDVVARAYDIADGDPIVGSPYDIDNYIYNNGSWFNATVTYATFGLLPNLAKATNTTLVANLNKEQTYRLGKITILGWSNTDLGIPSSWPFKPTTASNVNTLIKADGSYVTTVGDKATSPLFSLNYHAANGLVYQSVIEQFGPNGTATGGSIYVYNPDGTAAVTEDFGIASGASQVTLEDADFSSTTGGWTDADATMQFIAGTTTMQSIDVTNTNGTKEDYTPGTNGDWSEAFFNSSDEETESLAYGTFFDDALNKNVTGTEETDWPSETITIYAAGTSGAPTWQLPTGVPTDYPSAQAFWANAISATMGGTAAATAPATTSAQRSNLRTVGASVDVLHGGRASSVSYQTDSISSISSENHLAKMA